MNFLLSFLDQNTRAHLVNCMAIVAALVKKGVLTEKDVEAEIPEAKRLVEEEWERKVKESLE